ncbi:MAG: glycosyltransferase family 2 protein, partial [Nitrospirota bacterium]
LYVSSGKIKYIRQENGGVARARNTGIAASTGHYIALLDHDDLWMPDKIEKQVKFLGETGAKIVFCNGIGIPAGKPVLRKGIFRAGVEDVLETVLTKGYNLMPSSLLIDREVIEKTGFFEESIPGTDDWDFSISAA